MRNLGCEAECFRDPAHYAVPKDSHMCYVHTSKVFDDRGHVIKIQRYKVYEEIKRGNTIPFLRVKISFLLQENYGCKITFYKCFEFLKLLLQLASKCS